MVGFPSSNCLIEYAVIGVVQGINDWVFRDLILSISHICTSSQNYTLYSIEEMTEPCKTAAGHEVGNDSV